MSYATLGWRIGASALILGLVFACGVPESGQVDDALARADSDGDATGSYAVNPFWPRPLPDGWLLGNVVGVATDSRDYVWLVHRPNSQSGAAETPPVIAFDTEGVVVHSWGGPGEGYEWPQSNHGITFDHKGNLWIGGNGGDDAHVLKFTSDGQFLLQVGNAGGNAGSNDTENFGRVAKVFVDGEENEAYIADGYGNRRVAVLDADTGAFKRYWGAYGNQPDDSITFRYDPNAEPPQQFGSPVHCAELSHDRLLYVCDRSNDRIQVFEPDGTFLREAFIAEQTLGSGSVWDIAFSKDADQTYIYVADGINEKVHVVQRDTLEVLTSFGDGGRQPSQFFGVHSIATDSQGNVYTTETYEGKRVQRFVYKGMGPITAQDQGAVWPSAAQ